MSNSIVPCLFFRGNAPEAIDFYVSVFPGASIVQVAHYGPEAPEQEGQVMSIVFRLNGQDFYALNGEMDFTFTPAISLMVHCDTQKEIDTYWDKLRQGGEEVCCGWVRDRFGVSWQVVPSLIHALLASPDKNKTTAVMRVVHKSIKLDIAALQQAYDNA